MANKTLKDYAGITLRGLAMGAADVVPGVSGGTIAFITGIYEELLATLSSIRPSLLYVWKDDGLKAAWNKANLNFLIALILGIGISVFSLAHLLDWLLINEPVLLWSFFFGLVLASVFFVGRQVSKWTAGAVISLMIGATVAWFITSLPPMKNEATNLFIFLCGMVAICAMILPGISGSFILLILGAYEMIIKAVKEFDVTKILIFGAGCVVGILSFSHLLNWMFKKHKNITIALLTGFLLGSLQKLWPWQIKLQLLHVKSTGDEVHLMGNVLPQDFIGDPQLMMTIICFVIGFGIIFALERIAKSL
ncbi:MAG: putative membrane protein [Flavobacteriales bacterium]